ncbi:MAG: DUF4982 domain-containing protein [Paludibacter sp.]|jgi:beta-galactosidase|nr:DUF4982 domain-containing protein [Paludibacter sp.]
MKQIFSLLAIFSAVFIMAQSRQTINFDSDWKFSLTADSTAIAPDFNDADWRKLNLPHDWSIEGENLQNASGGGNMGYFPAGIAWYRKSFNLANFDKNQKWSIEFDGVYMNSDVWINGKHLGHYPYGYSSFAYDLTPFLKAKNNLIAVRVDNSLQPNSRWYTGSGIYRHVRLLRSEKLHFERFGIFIYTQNIDNNNATLKYNVSIINENILATKNTNLEISIYNSQNKIVSSAVLPFALDADSKTTVTGEIQVENPQLWSLDNPELYSFTAKIVSGKKEIDRKTEKIGIRSLEYDVDKGFLLNGKAVKMKGVNLHHDAGGVGAAVPERVWERRLEILKAGGCNAIRTAHNIPAPEFLDLCDRMGFLVMDEAFDEWIYGKRTYSYKLYFKDYYEKDLLAMLLRDRNHPSVVMWSIGNEIPDQSSDVGAYWAKTLIDICHRHDPTRLVTSGNDNIASDGHAATPEFLAAFSNDIVGYNYGDRWRDRRELIYSIDRHDHPDWRIVGSETGSIGGARGMYRIGNHKDKFEALYNTRFVDVEQRWKFTLLHDYVIGDFMWTGIDYYGESYWASRGATSGIIDNCGFEKDGYYFFKSIWTAEPVLHLMPHWNWEGREGQIIPVICFTNCDTVELFVNGKSYGTKYLEFPRKGTQGGWNTYPAGKVNTSTADLHLSWDVAYQKGEIKAIGRKNGKEITTQIVTADAPASIRLSADRNVIKAQPSDVAHIKVEILDKNGNIVPYADNLVKFNVSGGKLIGVESGNMQDLSSCKIAERKAFNGLCLAIVQAEKAGKIIITANSDDLTGDRIVVSSEE